MKRKREWPCLSLEKKLWGEQGWLCGDRRNITLQVTPSEEEKCIKNCYLWRSGKWRVVNSRGLLKRNTKP